MSGVILIKQTTPDGVAVRRIRPLVRTSTGSVELRGRSDR